MQIERRALYNSLRLNWLRDASLKVKNWQVEDLRTLPKEELFKRLVQMGFEVTPGDFYKLAQDYDSPEDMNDDLFFSPEMSAEESDQVFLIIFELWRREFPEKQTLSVFCDELDYQIDLCDSGKIVKAQDLQDILSSLLEILNDNADSGLSPKECQERIASLCAHDIEAFLYDYLSDEIDQGHLDSAQDFVEGFMPYIQDKRWFEFLDLRLKFQEKNLEEAVQGLLRKPQDISLDFYFDLLTFLAQHGNIKTYAQVAKKAITLFETEEDFADFLTLSADFYHLLDDEAKESKILQLMKSRTAKPEAKFNFADPALSEIKKIILSN